MTTATATYELLTNSRMESACCPRKHFLAYVAGIRRAVDAQPLRFGTAIHEGLDFWKQGMSTDEAIDRAIINYEDAHRPFEMEGEKEYAWLIEREQIARLLSAYFWRWEQANKDMEVLASEFEFQIPLVNPETGRESRTYRLGGKIDGIVRLAGGVVAVMEHKTTSNDIDPSSTYWRKLRIDSQISIYWQAAAAHGYDVQTVYYDVIRKPTIRPKQIPVLDADGCKIVLDSEGQRVFNKNGTPRQSADSKMGWTMQTVLESPVEYGERLTTDIGERPDFYFARQEIPRIEADLIESQYDVWQTGRMLADCEKSGHWPRRTSMCERYGLCPYFDLCCSGYDPASGVVPEGFMKLENIHPELS